MTRLDCTHDLATGDIVFRGRIAQADLARCDFDGLDRALLREPAEKASDLLLSAEMIFRKLGL